MNERDSEQVAHSLIARGYEHVSCETDADVVLLNTCSVRDMAEQKALGKMGMLGRMAKSRPETVFGFLGCMAQARGAELLKEIPHLDLVVGTQKFHRVADYVDDVVARKRSVVGIADPGLNRMDDLRFSIVDVEEEVGSQSTIRDQSLAPKQATAFVSIMQGCNMHCTFCIVPRTRGAERSRTISEIASEVRALVARGVKEVTLLGQIVNLYGRHEFPSGAAVAGRGPSISPFVQLLEAVSAIDGLERLRFTSPHPIGFRDDLIDAISRLPKIAEHVHLPLQSGSNRILKAMHRTYTAEKYAQLVGKIRAARPGIAITTDIIVGFPGETDADFRDTMRLVEQVGYDGLYIFKYSERPGTPAARLDDDVSREEKTARFLELEQAQRRHQEKIYRRYLDREIKVLIERPSSKSEADMTGHSTCHKVVNFPAPVELLGQVARVRVTQAKSNSLYGEILSAP